MRHEVDTRALGPWVLSLIVEGKSHELAVVRLGDGNYSVDWRGRSFEIELVDPLTHLAETSRGEAGKQGKRVVKAYMPGRVVEVRVQPGDRVEAGQPMVVLEAMKMQNEIQAERSGRREPGLRRRRPGGRRRRSAVRSRLTPRRLGPELPRLPDVGPGSDSTVSVRVEEGSA